MDPDAGREAGSKAKRSAAFIRAEPESLTDEVLSAVGDAEGVLLSLQPIMEAVGEQRWERLAVKAQDRAVEQLGLEAPGAYCTPLGEGWILAAARDLTREEALACVYRALKTVMREIIGTDARAVDGVMEVLALGPRSLEARGVDADTLKGAEQALDDKRRVEAIRAKAREPIVAADGRVMRTTVEAEPFINLQSGVTIGARLRSTVLGGRDWRPLTRDTISRLAGVDRVKIDWSALVNGFEELRTPMIRPATLIVPVSYATLTTHRGRAQVCELLEHAYDIAGYGLIGEIYGVEGAPQAQLQEALWSLRPYVLFTLARLEPRARAASAAPLRAAGFHGLAFDCPKTASPEAFLRWARSAMTKAQRVGPTMILYGLKDLSLSQELAELGVSHATVRQSLAESNLTTWSRRDAYSPGAPAAFAAE